MPNPVKKLVLLAAMMLAAGTLHAQSQTVEGRQIMDHAAIQATVDANNAAVSAGNIEAALAMFEPGAAMVAQPGVTVAGTDALRAAFRQFLAINPKITATGHDIVQADDIALHSFTWTMAGKSPDGSAITQTGFSTVVLRKQADGRWLMVIDNPFADLLLQKK